MTATLTAIYDGKVFQLDSPINLEPNTRVRLTIETSELEQHETSSFLQTARSLCLNGPSDWSAHLDDYLYGEPVHVC
ncbi:MAG: hypothetical protein HYZ34_04605 [Ignavibacteriae bacterium]|nr:hypothetical protein [Ignavibacteriota bacterium]